MEDEKKKNEKMEYNTKVRNIYTGEVELENVFAYYDEENKIYCVSDSLILDDGEIRVEIAFCLTEDCRPLGLVWNSYFGDRLNSLRNEVPIQEAYNEYKLALAQNIRIDMNKKYDNYISINKNFIVLNNERKRKKVK